MPDESAVIDAAPDLSAPEAPETSAPETHSEPTESVETPQGESPDTEGQQPSAEVDPATSQKPVYDAATKKLDPAVKAELDKMRETNPVLAARIRNSLAQGEALRAVLPGGVKEAQQLKSTFEDLGGEDGIQELRGLGDEFNSLIEAYNGNDPKFIDELVNANAESFQKLAPGIMDKFAEMDPGGFGSYVSRVLINDMRNNDVPMHMRLLARFTDNEDAKTSLKAISDYLNGVENLAKAPVVTPITKKAPDSREVELNKRETDFKRGEWKADAERSHFQIFNSTLTGLLGDRKLSAEDRSTLNGWYTMRMQQIVASRKDFNSKIEKYFQSGDQKGYQRYLESFRKEAVPDALKYAVGKVLPAGNGKRPVAAPAAQPKPGAPVPKADAGFKMVGKAPQHNDINTRLTSTDMIRARKAILIDGTKVQW